MKKSIVIAYFFSGHFQVMGRIILVLVFQMTTKTYTIYPLLFILQMEKSKQE